MKYRNLSIILKHDNTTHSSKPYGRGSHVCTINDLSNIYEIMDATDQVVASIGGENISSVILGEIMKIIKDYIPVKNTVRHMGPSKEEQRELDELKKIRDRYCRPDDYKPEDGIKTTKRAWLPLRTASLDNDYHLGVWRQITPQSRGSNISEDKTTMSDEDSSCGNLAVAIEELMHALKNDH